LAPDNPEELSQASKLDLTENEVSYWALFFEVEAKRTRLSIENSEKQHFITTFYNLVLNCQFVMINFCYSFSECAHSFSEFVMRNFCE
jgi:hypothetical protein